MKPPVDWAGAIARHVELSSLMKHLERTPIAGSWRVIDEIKRELAVVPHPNWLLVDHLIAAQE